MDYRAALRADCARCQALCCVSLPFDRCESFGFDKPANVPCQYLEPGCGCSIHGELRARGQAGCAAYDCYGAGQRITQELFVGVSWQSHPETSAALFEAFRRLTRVHELRLLLHEAGRLSLSRSRASERQELLAQLEPARGLSREALAALELPELEAAVYSWLRGLARELSPQPTRRRLALATDTKSPSASPDRRRPRLEPT
jgi:hypothetical protein